MKRLILSLALSGVCTFGWTQTHLSPNQLGGGKLPGTHADLVFTLSNGNWTPQVALPAVANDKASIKIVSHAGYNAQVLQTNTDVPLPSMTLSAGQNLHYVYSAGQKRWEIVAPTTWAPNNGSTLNMPVPTARVVRVRLGDGAWVPALNLPVNAVDGSLVMVRSDATWNSRIDPSHVLHASTMPLRSRDEYAFAFNQRLGKWVLSKGPETVLPWSTAAQGQLPVPSTALTRLTVPAGAAATTLRLPARAGDRDRIVITSNATNRSTIASTHNLGTMTIGNGQTYEFMWNTAASAWVLMQAPRSHIKLQDLKSPLMAALQTPVTEVLAWDGNWRPSVTLPAKAQSGDRVVVKSYATWSFAVDDGGTGGFGRHTVTTGEEVAFVRAGQSWQRETDTIRILLTYSQDARAKLGANAIRTRQIESLRLTNESLENSGAKFRFHIAGLMEVPTLSNDMGTSLGMMRTHTLIQGERNRVKADSVYYEGVEGPYCGLAWVNSTPSASHMMSLGTINCGTNVMRHELGHNMGLPHGDGVIPTVMSGNAVPFFATPKRFDATLGLPMGHGAQRPDEVTLMNNNAPAVSRFR